MKKAIAILALLFPLVGLAQTEKQAKRSSPDDYVGINIYRLPLPVEQTRPIVIPTTAEDSTYVELPYAIVDWVGRGFSSNIEVAGGDFAFRMRKGDRRIGITPLIANAHRVLTVVMEGDRVLTLEFVPAASRDTAFRAVTFYDATAYVKRVEAAIESAREEKITITRESLPPKSLYSAPSQNTARGLVAFMRLLYNMPADKARNAIALNTALTIQTSSDSPPVFSAAEFTVTQRFAVRDSVTSSLGLAVVVRNQTNKRLLFDNKGWVVRVGDAVYPVGGSYGLVDFSGELAPGAESVAFLVMTRTPDGSPIRLLPNQEFRAMPALVSTTNDYPVFPVDVALPE